MTHFKIIVAAVIVASVIPGTCLPACAAVVPFDSPDFLPNDTHCSPWVYPLKYLHVKPGAYNYVWTMYCVNVSYYAYIDPNGGIVSRLDSSVLMDQDVTQYAFHLMDLAASASGISVLYAVGDWSPARLKGLLLRNGQTALIVKGRVGGKWNGLKSHAKVFQADNGSNLYVTVHGSVNLQTVELTCKANNALRFVEDSPRLYSDFTGLSRAVERDDGSRNFPDGFAFIAYPAEYRTSGVMSFLVDAEGIIYEKDLGKASSEAGAAMVSFNPDATWSSVSDEDAPAN